MAKRLGKHTVKLDTEPRIISWASVVGKKEGEGPLGKGFDLVYTDTKMGQPSWEKAESSFLSKAIELAKSKAGQTDETIDVLFSGDLLNQCIGSAFAVRDLDIPFAGLYGACSTMALSLCMASLCLETGGFKTAIASACSHFCSAEKQFRYPLEYGGQRTQSAQWTVTGAGSTVLSGETKEDYPRITHIHLGQVRDYGIQDANNMGAAMAPAAAKTISDFLNDTKTVPSDYDLILTGDLGKVGTALLKELMKTDSLIDIEAVHNDCGLLIFDNEKQDVHSGGSGCGCSASVLCSKILNEIKSGVLKKVMFVATGALMSSVSSLQGESIPSIAHGVIIEGKVNE